MADSPQGGRSTPNEAGTYAGGKDCLGCKLTALTMLTGTGAYVIYHSRQARVPATRGLMILGGSRARIFHFFQGHSCFE